MGHGRFLIFYLLAGAVAALAQCWADPASDSSRSSARAARSPASWAPTSSSSRTRGCSSSSSCSSFIDVVEIPALFLIGFWFAVQILGGVGASRRRARRWDVAFWAHVARPGRRCSGRAGVPRGPNVSRSPGGAADLHGVIICRLCVCRTSRETIGELDDELLELVLELRRRHRPAAAAQLVDLLGQRAAGEAGASALRDRRPSASRARRDT